MRPLAAPHRRNSPMPIGVIQHTGCRVHPIPPLRPIAKEKVGAKDFRPPQKRVCTSLALYVRRTSPIGAPNRCKAVMQVKERHVPMAHMAHGHYPQEAEGRGAPQRARRDLHVHEMSNEFDCGQMIERLNC